MRNRVTFSSFITSDLNIKMRTELERHCRSTRGGIYRSRFEDHLSLSHGLHPNHAVSPAGKLLSPDLKPQALTNIERRARL
ncbi:hypothetical protein RRG08_034768 [Elysia crispata]|uniref:Uncharacterized protein n=1 Tax=Elysia crispata TaxID=231223 RepID=A0AAE0YA71_9GAST|nr:hypothetical protein RRG08_034768 [Elysia crispata]